MTNDRGAGVDLRSRRDACILSLLLLLQPAIAWGQPVPRNLTTRTLPPTPPATSPHSSVFDSAAADTLRLRHQPTYVESIIVEGRDPDARRARRKSVELTFAEALLAPPPAAATGLRLLNDTPCHAIQSSRNSIGNSFAPLEGCPGAANTP